MSKLHLLKTPHERAERLMDLNIDAARGEGEIGHSDLEFLNAHLSECSECRALSDARSAAQAVLTNESRMLAPEGFAERVAAAAARGDKPREDHDFEDKNRFRMMLMTAGAIAACFLIATQVSNPTPTHDPGITGAPVAAAGAGTAIEREGPDFNVRATDLGAAEVRKAIDELAGKHGGRVVAQGGALRLEVPRTELVAVVQSLAQRGRFKVGRTDAGDIDPDRSEVVFLVELD